MAQNPPPSLGSLPPHCASSPANLYGASNVSQYQTRQPLTGVSLPQNSHSFPTTSLTTGGSTPSCPGDTVLNTRNHFNITQSIKEMGNADLIALGQALGLFRHKLQRMNDMPGDMVAAWLRQEDRVISETGDPTWRVLADACDKVDQGGFAKKIRNKHNIPHPVTEGGSPNKPAPDRTQVGVEETTDTPGLPCEDDEEGVQLKKCLEQHNLKLGNIDRQVLIDNGIISIETLVSLTAEDFAGLKVTVGGRRLLKKFWTKMRNNQGRMATDHDQVNVSKEEVGHQHNQGRMANDHDQVNVIKYSEAEEEVGRPLQETGQPNSVANKQIESPTHVGELQNSTSDKPNTPVPVPVIVPHQGPTSTASNMPSDEDLEPDSESGDDNKDPESDSDKASFNPHPRVLNDGQLTYQPKLKLDNDSSEVTTFETEPIVRPIGRGSYEMKSREHGVALIINNKMFANTQRHKKREGTDRDEENLVETFRFLGYRVKVRRQCKKEKIEKLFDKMSRWIKAVDDSFVCCILSHGDENIVYGSDSKDVPIRTDADSIEMKLSNCKELIGKPKIFFISTCRGNKKGRGERQSDGSEPRPYRADFAFCYSTVPGEKSWRHTEIGTFYVSELCRVLCEKATTRTLSDIQLEVTDRVKKIDVYYQLPAMEQQMINNVFFFDDLA